MHRSLYFLPLLALATGCLDAPVQLAEDVSVRSRAAHRPNLASFSLAPDQDPPGNLAPSQVPQFVSIGWDDNAYPDSIHWIAEFLETHHNPPGAGNDATFDGSPMHNTFFQTGSYATPDGVIGANGATTEDVIAAWRRLYDTGNELGNHTYRHTGDRPVEEFTLCNDVLTDLIGVPEHEIYGFRAPFLYYTRASFDTRAQLGFYYDCSIEQPWSAKSGADDYWPFTLDHQSPYAPREPLPSYPGMWEMPVYTLMIAGGNRIQTGFDFNLWVTEKLDEDTVFQTLVNALDARYDGNRAPMLFGAHTDEYSEHNTAFNQNAATNSTWHGRRETIENFLLYAASKPDVRIVNHIDILRWMENPTPLGQCVPSCSGKACGDDGCGGSCGDCPTGQVCDQNFECVDDTCEPSCTGLECGDDGCGGSCGSCGPDETCNAGTCEPDTCEPQCDPGQQCGDDGCGGQCGVCDSGETCQSGQCVPNSGDCSGLANWVLGTSYDEHDQVQNLGQKYQCKPWPFFGWCGQSAYEPGKGFAWEDAWIALGTCGSCTPQCNPGQCGDDGCGGTCECPSGEVCNAGSCEPVCTPQCNPGECGSDGCGGTCDCPSGEVCNAGTCEPVCTPQCNPGECGDDGCGGTCDCPSGEVCNAGTCEPVCTPQCNPGECGDDGCGGTCECPSGEVCNAGTCEPVCTPQCQPGQECGDDGCGGSCGDCPSGQICTIDGQCESSCTPDCDGKACGPDGCGGTCGTCPTGQSCTPTGQCEDDQGGDCAHLPDWQATSYAEGAEIKNNNQHFRCKTWPYNGWCGISSYEPGVGFAWTDAWDLVGDCN